MWYVAFRHRGMGLARLPLSAPSRAAVTQRRNSQNKKLSAIFKNKTHFTSPFLNIFAALKSFSDFRLVRRNSLQERKFLFQTPLHRFCPNTDAVPMLAPAFSGSRPRCQSLSSPLTVPCGMCIAHLSPRHSSFELLSWQRASDRISVADYSIVPTSYRIP